MAAKKKADVIREAVAVFEDEDTLVAAADELMSSGFDRAELSLVAGEAAVSEKLGHLYERVEKEEDRMNHILHLNAHTGPVFSSAFTIWLPWPSLAPYSAHC